MKTKELRYVIREMILSEVTGMDPSVLKLIDEYGELNDEIDVLKNKLEKLTSRYSQIEKEVRPVLEGLRELGQNSVQTDNYLISIKRMGYDRVNVKYKESFEAGLTKVNAQTRKILEDLLESTKTITSVVSSIGVQKVKGEGIFTNIYNKVKSFVSKLVPSIRRVNTETDKLQATLKNMLK
jgi:seryl-tRNA synthetase